MSKENYEWFFNNLDENALKKFLCEILEKNVLRETFGYLLTDLKDSKKINIYEILKILENRDTHNIGTKKMGFVDTKVELYKYNGNIVRIVNNNTEKCDVAEIFCQELKIQENVDKKSLILLNDDNIFSNYEIIKHCCDIPTQFPNRMCNESYAHATAKAVVDAVSYVSSAIDSVLPSMSAKEFIPASMGPQNLDGIIELKHNSNKVDIIKEEIKYLCS